MRRRHLNLVSSSCTRKSDTSGRKMYSFVIFLFMHGWALILGGYPDEFELGERLDNGEKVKLDDAFAAYCFVFFGLLGFMILVAISLFAS